MRPRRSFDEIKSLISDIKNILKELYGDNLVKIILFGSFARNEATFDSDIDIAVVLHDKVNQSEELDRLHNTTYHLALEYGELISFYPVSEDEIQDTQWPLHYHIQEEGIKV